MKYLLLWELSKKQDFIFKGNKLKECIGASNIIKSFSEGFKDSRLKDDHYIIRGGGKLLYYFDSESERRQFISDFSIDVLKKYPGLELFIVTYDYDDESDIDIKAAIGKIYDKLDKKKRMRSNSCMQIGFGIERKCQSTGYPASYKIEDRYISPEIKCKIDHSDDNSFKEVISEDGKYKLLKSIDGMVKDESKSYLAIVHIDGNGMGKRIEMISNSINRKKDESIEDFNRRYIKVLREFSNQIDDSNIRAFKQVCKRIEENRDNIKSITKIDQGAFPLRPLIIAGDDITFICNGSIGIECARIFIEELKKNLLNISEIHDNDFKSLNACAGVAIFRRTYPFRVAYRLAEELCENAKSFLGEKKLQMSAIDFHLCQGEISSSLKDIREDNYKVYNSKDYSLAMRPLIIGRYDDFDDGKWRNYDNFIQSLTYIDEAIKDKNIGRSKIKQLRNELARGKDAVEMFLKFYNIKPGCVLKPLGDVKGDFCFNNERDSRSRTYKCMYFDAIEIMDFFKKLD